MLYLMRHTLGGRLREARRRRSLTQAALAARSGTSRVTIARLEAGPGRDVRVGTLVRLCQALDLEIAAEPAGARLALERRLERERERVRRVERRLAHALLAARLVSSPGAEAGALLARARAAVDRWERERLCSHHYVSRWRAMLEGPPERVARALLEPGDWADALFQNTPFSSALEVVAS
jgi:transcriptional regulator with XRE-family HTH domain